LVIFGIIYFHSLFTDGREVAFFCYVTSWRRLLAVDLPFPLVYIVFILFDFQENGGSESLSTH